VVYQWQHSVQLMTGRCPIVPHKLNELIFRQWPAEQIALIFTAAPVLQIFALGFMLAVNLPTMVLLGGKAMGAYKDYFRRLKLGTLGQDK